MKHKENREGRESISVPHVARGTGVVVELPMSQKSWNPQSDPGRVRGADLWER